MSNAYLDIVVNSFAVKINLFIMVCKYEAY